MNRLTSILVSLHECCSGDERLSKDEIAASVLHAAASFSIPRPSRHTPGARPQSSSPSQQSLDAVHTPASPRTVSVPRSRPIPASPLRRVSPPPSMRQLSSHNAPVKGTVPAVPFTPDLARRLALRLTTAPERRGISRLVWGTRNGVSPQAAFCRQMRVRTAQRQLAARCLALGCLSPLDDDTSHQPGTLESGDLADTSENNSAQRSL